IRLAPSVPPSNFPPTHNRIPLLYKPLGLRAEAPPHGQVTPTLPEESRGQVYTFFFPPEGESWGRVYSFFFFPRGEFGAKVQFFFFRKFFRKGTRWENAK